jgi:hypothetical protein
MSAQPLQRGSGLSDKARQLVDFLSKEVNEQGGVMYVKGKFISDDVGLSPKEIGQMMKQIQDTEVGLTVEKWSYTGATTWRVSE